jgi:hypothetical protein
VQTLRALGILGVCLAASLCALEVSCSSNESSGGSGLGESCAATADCNSGLVCVGNTCSPSGHTVDGGGVSEAAAPDVTPDVTTGVDAQSPDVAVNRSVDASEDQPSSQLGQIGEACQTSRDCAPGLGCVPSSGGASVCDLLSYGLLPSGKTCTGECGAASDCCALPLGLGISGLDDAGAYVSVSNCSDILSVLLGGSTAACAGNPTPGSSAANACFYYQTYCKCAPSTWTCSSNRCLYAARCQSTIADTLGGCPSFTRTRSTLNTTCDMPANTCHSGANMCATSADCDGLAVTDEVGITCRGGDCTCYMSACYLKCAKDLDCPNGDSCDSTKNLCVPSPCMNDAQCFSQLGKARAKCQSGVCGIPCTVDHDCSPSGDIAGQPFNGTVCGSNGLCAPVGCMSDSDCSGVGSQRLYCATPQASNVHSAITN